MAEQDNVQPAASTQAEATQAEATQAEATQAEVSAQPDLSGLAAPARELLNRLELALANFHPQVAALQDLPQVTVMSADLAKVCRVLKDDPGISASQLMCLACVDYEEYFQLVYMLHSIDPEGTMVIKADVTYDQPKAPSVASVWRAADWYEREAHDLFGVVFEGHPDLAPLLLYEGFEGFPGRKEFPFHEYQEF